MRLISEITTKTEVIKSTYPEVTKHTLAEAFADLKRQRMADLFSRDGFDDAVDVAAYRGLDALRAGETLTIGQTIALWYVARYNEIEAEWLADIDMTEQAHKSKLSGIKRQITSKY